ncbi:MAG: hypothetical protein Hyperionvirus6_81 [Hyperionvirus sp.]|uniref:Uncharacterized protein n=1 Tax=Hyperionvirus sp. TaxID=2487770 RepID=A0A3G5A7Y9_9VIRU|nr:MAG: hypothetical protein Hyperionvirus6_81 [Hyperionvirus sp.]
MLIDPLKYLTNLTYLELQSIIGDVEISSLRLLETLIIKGTSPRLNFPSTPLDNLSHLEISSYAYKLNFPFLKNLTTLDMGSGWLCGNRERIELKYLKKLILREVRYCSYIDISGLNFLTSLDILNCAVDTFVRQGALFANDTLQSLSVSSFYWNLDDSSLAGVPNLKYFYLDTFSYGGSKMNSSCFKDLENLFRLEGRKHNLSKECIASLKKKGIMIRYIP